MNRLIYKLYEILPKNIINELGKNNLLKPIRDSILRSNNHFRKIEVTVSKDYLNYHVNFHFTANLKTAEKAKNKGIENSLLRNSFKLFAENVIQSNDKTPVIFDIGANFGYLSLVWANTICKNNGTIFSFEPNPDVFDCFKNSVLKNNLQDTIKLHNFAVSSKSGQAEFCFDETSSNIDIDNSSRTKTKIKIVSVDDFISENKIQNCDMIKIDVDGHEYEILKGASETLNKFKPILIIESNNDRKILEFISPKNYRMLDMNLNEVKSDVEEIPANLFCVAGM